MSALIRKPDRQSLAFRRSAGVSLATPRKKHSASPRDCSGDLVSAWYHGISDLKLVSKVYECQWQQWEYGPGFGGAHEAEFHLASEYQHRNAGKLQRLWAVGDWDAL